MPGKMKVEIWSDVMCPFCYIGKRRFEKALHQIGEKDNINIEWKSYQLNPYQKTEPNKNIHQYLSEHKGISIAQAEQMSHQVTQMAQNEGLDYHLNQSVPANSMNAHCFSHFAKTFDKQNEAEELLFKAYFTDGKNIDDLETLLQLGDQLGLDRINLKISLEEKQFVSNVKSDIEEAIQFNIRGVPFFVFDRKYGLSGAQDVNTFIEVLKKSLSEWQKETLT